MQQSMAPSLCVRQKTTGLHKQRGKQKKTERKTIRREFNDAERAETRGNHVGSKMMNSPNMIPNASLSMEMGKNERTVLAAGVLETRVSERHGSTRTAAIAVQHLCLPLKPWFQSHDKPFYIVCWPSSQIKFLISFNIHQMKSEILK